MPRSEPLSAAFRCFWPASAFSDLGDGTRIVALPILAVRLTDDPQLVSGLVVTAFLL